MVLKLLSPQTLKLLSPQIMVYQALKQKSQHPSSPQAPQPKCPQTHNPSKPKTLHRLHQSEIPNPLPEYIRRLQSCCCHQCATLLPLHCCHTCDGSIGVAGDYHGKGLLAVSTLHRHTYCSSTDAFSHVTASNVKSLAFQASITDALYISPTSSI